jgi:hypothetical protein
METTSEKHPGKKPGCFFDLSSRPLHSRTSLNPGAARADVSPNPKIHNNLLPFSSGFFD